MGTTQVADARFLRRIMFVLVLLTIATGLMAGLTTVFASAPEGAGLCQAAGLLCQS